MDKVSVFKRYAMEVGQKIRIEDGPRRGDWLVIGVSEHKVRLRCPISGFEANWERFCYLVAEEERPWPEVESGEPSAS